MEKTTKKAATRVHKHREDGEEAVKRSADVVPIDGGKGRESPEGNTNVNPSRDAIETKRPPKSDSLP